MTSPRPLFVVGSKRSGSSLLVNLLNLHPSILVTHESDIVWILFNLLNGRDVDTIPPYPGDEGKGLRETVERCRDLLTAFDRSGGYEAVRTTFFAVMRQVNNHGRGAWDKAANKDSLAWVGDKKPVQQADPKIQQFLHRVFPEARYMHIVRDPRFVVASMTEAAETWGEESVPDYWRQARHDLLCKWAMHEEWVQRIEKRNPESIHTVRLEDLSEHPVGRVSDMFESLGLNLPQNLEDVVQQWVWRSPNQRHKGTDSALPREFREVASRYGYA